MYAYTTKFNVKNIFLFFTFLLSFFLFFQNDYLPRFFDAGSEDWYINFSVMIFHPNEAYWNESILLPLIGKLLGASRSLVGYKTLCAIVSVMILPTLAILSLNYFKNIWTSVIFITVFSVSFRYLWTYDLGHPDPLTILLLSAIPFLKSKISVFSFALLATLSHFSMVLIALLELSLVCYAFSNQKPLERLRMPLLLTAALFIGRAFLALWYFIFHYTSPLGRIEFIINHGVVFFYSRYLQNLFEFWLIPGVPFLLINAVIILIFIYKRMFLLTVSIVFAISMSYLAVFITVDGLRVFAVVCCASYVFILINTLSLLDKKWASKP